MTTKSTALMLIAAMGTGLLLTGAADAQDERGPRGERPAFGEIDANGDGQVTEAELQAFGEARRAARFAEMDTDGNGSLSRQEIATGPDERIERRIDRIMERDANGDGELSAEELAAGRDGDGERRDRGDRGARAFERADADDDGVLTEAEWDAMAKRQARR